jgi:hypothetical protein
MCCGGLGDFVRSEMFHESKLVLRQPGNGSVAISYRDEGGTKSLDQMA